MKKKYLLTKKAQLDDPVDEDSGFLAGSIMYYIKLIIIIVLLVIYLVVPGMRLLNSQSKIPSYLQEDIYLARLTNVCLANHHYPFQTIDQDKISAESFNKEHIDSCFKKVPFTDVSLEWEGPALDGLNKTKAKHYLTIDFNNLKKDLTMERKVLLVIEGETYSAKLKVGIKK